MPSVWNAASAAPWPFDGYVKVLLLTGQRRTETAAMRWADIDPEAAIWTIPASVSKSGRAHQVPLPPVVMEIIRTTGRTTSPLVFPGRGGGHMNGFNKRMAALREKLGGPDYTLHDLRRTARSLLSRAGVRPDISERVLGHAIPGVEGVYDRHSDATEKADALARLAALVDRIVTPPQGTVIPLAFQAAAP